ncbi:hypothetical protein RFI_15694 [Reticulomyxa filosa]|uniref:Uncharacterized protein n=1 Tax=Reticulomyxa filosa TaxID=46433 RepID=X6N5F8_RETFI|nr:hypothetical protein RFI_15694 [Reticulomyxa filosa]|eukprot:ETO21510.1 hypothetical protein RFI_15694 [Reticulomyxa filosa]
MFGSFYIISYRKINVPLGRLKKVKGRKRLSKAQGNDGNTELDTKTEETTLVERMLLTTMKMTKIVVPFFLILLTVGIVCIVLGLVDTALDSDIIGELIICTIMGGSLGAWGVYKWGTVQEELVRMNEENSKYENEILHLQSTKEALSTQVSEMQSTVNQLKGSVDELNNQLRCFDELKQELEKIAEHNQDIGTLIDDVTNIFSDMRRLCLANEKAFYLGLYYDVAFKDKNLDLFY